MPVEEIKPKEEVDRKIISSTIEAAKSSTEVIEKLSNILAESLDKEKLKKMILEEALKDPELRNKIVLEVIKKL